MEKILELIRTNNDLHLLKEELDHFHPYDIASIFSELTEDERFKLYRLFDTNELADIFSYIDDPSDYLEEMNTHHAANIMSEMDSDDATDALGELEEEKRDEILSFMNPEDRQDILELAQYSENQAGSIMSRDFIAIDKTASVKEAMKVVIDLAPDVSDIDTVFVNEGEKMVGFVELKKLIMAKMPTVVSDIYEDQYHFVNPETDIEDAIKIIKDYDIYSLPVIKEDKIIGVITMDDAIQTLVDEQSDDYAKLSGLTGEEEHKERTINSIKKRIPWLAILLILDFFVIMVISSFEKTIENLPILVFFQAVILGVAGNAGTQSLAVSVRKISQGELKQKKHVLIHLLNELLTGILLGAVLGLFALGFVTLFLTIKGEKEVFQVAFAVALSIFVAMSFSSLFGGLIPILFEKIHIDPAVASGPFITTLNDILAVLIYFEIASIMISIGFI